MWHLIVAHCGRQVNRMWQRRPRVRLGITPPRRTIWWAGRPIVISVERALSSSTHSPDRLGAPLGAFSAKVGWALEPFTPDGMLTEENETYALIASWEGAA
jgi:hypothetical protein